MKADFPGVCPMCSRDYPKNADIVPHKNDFIHRTCAPGQDDVDQPARKKTAKKTPAPVAVVEPEPVRRDPSMLFEIPTIPETGLLLPNLDEDTYHAHRGSLSSTGAKRIRVAPALFKHELDHPVTKRVFDYGSVCHKYALGVGPEVVDLTRVDPKTKAVALATDRRSPSTQQMEKTLKAEGKIGLLAREHAAIKAMAEKLREHKLAMKLLEKGQPEVSGFAYDEDTGVLRRGRADWLRKRVIVDYKSAVTADPRGLGRVAFNNGWYQQTPYYIDLFRDLGYDIGEFYHVVQEKTAPYLVSVVKLSQNAIDLGRAHNTEALRMYRDCTESGVWPGYGDPELFTPIDIPSWAYRGEVEIEEVAA